MTGRVHNNIGLHRFELCVDDHLAFAYYRVSAGLITFEHTRLPDELWGRGIGSALAQGALELVRAQGDKVLVECAFMAKYMSKHPEFDDLKL
jgi:predicted GNAT family acetyltransferase